jgi:alpha-glucosidase
VNVQTESAEPDSLLNWNKTLIHMRRDLPALHDGGEVMLDAANAKVLSYVRTAPAGAASVVVVMNMSTEAQTVSLDVAAAGVKGERVMTLLTDAPSLEGATSLKRMTVPACGVWVGSVQ